MKEVKDIATKRTDDKRGKARDRRIRTQKLLWRYGNGTTCPCVHCNTELTAATLQQDRIIPGGPYRMTNVQPSCESCNLLRGNSPEQFLNINPS